MSKRELQARFNQLQEDHGALRAEHAKAIQHNSTLWCLLIAAVRRYGNVGFIGAGAKTIPPYMELTVAETESVDLSTTHLNLRCVEDAVRLRVVSCVKCLDAGDTCGSCGKSTCDCECRNGPLRLPCVCKEKLIVSVDQGSPEGAETKVTLMNGSKILLVR